MFFLNKKVLRSFLKVKIELAWRISMGSSFHNVGAASANERSPNVAKPLIVGRWRKSAPSDLKLQRDKGLTVMSSVM